MFYRRRRRQIFVLQYFASISHISQTRAKNSNTINIQIFTMFCIVLHIFFRSAPLWVLGYSNARRALLFQKINDHSLISHSLFARTNDLIIERLY